MEQMNDEDEKPIPRQFASLDILRAQIEEEGKAAEERIFEGVDIALEEKGPYIAEFHRASTTDEILAIHDSMLNDYNYLKNVDMRKLTRELKKIKTLNDNVLNTDIWKSKEIYNMYKLVKLYANINTPEDLQEKFNTEIEEGFDNRHRWRKIPRQVFMKYSKNFKTNNPDIWTRETAKKFGQLWKKIRDEDTGSGRRTLKKRKRPSRKRPSRKRPSRKRPSRKRPSRKRHSRKRHSRKRHSRKRHSRKRPSLSLTGLI
jgi:hypothetical protein